LDAVALAVAVGVLLAPRTLAKAQAIEVGDLGDRVLVIAAHPDDEVLACGGTVQRLVACGASVRILFVTAGDGYRRAARRLAKGSARADHYLALGEVRHRESVAAADVLGVAASDVVSLGFPDGGIAEIWGRPEDDPHGHRSRTTATDAVPYSWARVPEAPYTKRALVDALAGVIGDFTPTTVIAPGVRDSHPDHAAIGEAVHAALGEAGFAGRHLTVLVHYRLYPYPWGYVPSRALEPPPSLLDAGTTWYSVALDAGDIRCKQSAMGPDRRQNRVADLRWFMSAFVRRNELFAEKRPAS